MPLKTESLEEPDGLTMVSGGLQTFASVMILLTAAEAARFNISVAHLPRSQES